VGINHAVGLNANGELVALVSGWSEDRDHPTLPAQVCISVDNGITWQPATITKVPADPPYTYHPYIELYDLTAASWEFDNLADSAQHTEVQEELMAQLFGWMEETEDPLLNGVPPSPMHRETMRQLQEAAEAYSVTPPSP